MPLNEVNDLRDRLIETNYESEDRPQNWSRCKMQAEEAIQRLDRQTRPRGRRFGGHVMSRERRTLHAVLDREAELQADYVPWLRT